MTGHVLTPMAFQRLHQSLKAVIEDTFMYDFYRVLAPDGRGVGGWHIAWNGLRGRAAIVAVSGSNYEEVHWIDATSAAEALAKVGGPA